jgi:hypothetical protein
MNFWDDPDLRPSSDYVKFIEPGDGVTGKIVSIRKHTFDDGTVAAQLVINTPDGDRTVSASQAQLKSKLAELKPGVGDWIAIEFERVERRAGGKMLKHFTVTVGPSSASTTQAAPVAHTTTAAAPAERFPF